MADPSDHKKSFRSTSPQAHNLNPAYYRLSIQNTHHKFTIIKNNHTIIPSLSTTTKENRMFGAVSQNSCRMIRSLVAKQGVRSDAATTTSSSVVLRHQFAALSQLVVPNTTQGPTAEAAVLSRRLLNNAVLSRQVPSTTETFAFNLPGGSMNLMWQRPLNESSDAPNDDIIPVNNMNDWILDDPMEDEEEMDLMNRNGRSPKKANKGKRPCSRVSRRRKKSQYGRRKR